MDNQEYEDPEKVIAILREQEEGEKNDGTI